MKTFTRTNTLISSLVRSFAIFFNDSSIDRPPQRTCSKWFMLMIYSMEVWRKDEIISLKCSASSSSSSLLTFIRIGVARHQYHMFSAKRDINSETIDFVFSSIKQLISKRRDFLQEENDWFTMTSSLNLSNEAWNFVMNNRVDIDRWEDIHSHILLLLFWLRNRTRD